MRSALSTSSASHSDRKSTRLNSSHTIISYAVFCLKKKNPHPRQQSELRPPSPAAPPARGPRVNCGPPPRLVFFFNDPATTEIYPLSLHDALPISRPRRPAT